jgi:hypothetical protein
MLEVLAYLLEPAIWALAFIACLFVIATFAATSEISGDSIGSSKCDRRLNSRLSSIPVSDPVPFETERGERTLWCAVAELGFTQLTTFLNKKKQTVIANSSNQLWNRSLTSNWLST